MARQYTNEQRQRAVALYIEHGTAEAARITGYPSRTIKDWAKKAGAVVAQARDKTETAREELARTNEQRREAIKEKLLTQAESLLDRMNEQHVDYKGQHATRVVYDLPHAADVKSYAIAVGVLIDKFRLENGEATSKSEVTLEQAVSKIDAEIEKLTREMEEAEQRKASK